MIRVASVTHDYGAQRALDAVSFEVRAGEVVGFLGPNGAGKSTLFKLLSTYLPVQSGAIEVAGFDVARAPLEAVASKSPLGLRRMKALIDDGLQQPVDTALRLEILASEVHSLSHDQREGLAAFNDKRKPVFTGR